MICPQQGWFPKNFGTYVDDRKSIRASGEKGENVINVGRMIRLVIYKLVDGDDFPVMGEHHHTEHRRGYRLHRIDVDMSKQDILIKWGIDKFNVDEDGFSPKLDRGILEHPFRG